MSFCFYLPLNLHKPLTHTPFPISIPKPSFSLSLSLSLGNSHICFSSSSSSQNPERKEFLWLREEQRWLREERRWLREEQRWCRERDSLLVEIQSLNLRIQALESKITLQGGDSVSAANVTALLQVLKEKNLIAESTSSASPMAFEEKVEEKKEVIRVSEKKRKALRKGSEGEEVREMQEALQKMGFYSGEEDMEYSSFSTGTERAVKTWQATLGALEDGIMTAELLERLYMEQRIWGDGLNASANPEGSTQTVSQKEGANGSAVASVTEISEMQQKVVKEGAKGVEVSKQRVFLIGENRWEEPSRLIGRDEQIGGGKSKNDTTKCLTCRGEGRLMCSECDGTGEPNIEPQFLEWIDEGAKCPYCEGLGYTICDMCGGK